MLILDDGWQTVEDDGAALRAANAKSPTASSAKAASDDRAATASGVLGAAAGEGEVGAVLGEARAAPLGESASADGGLPDLCELVQDESLDGELVCESEVATRLRSNRARPDADARPSPACSPLNPTPTPTRTLSPSPSRPPPPLLQVAKQHRANDPAQHGGSEEDSAMLVSAVAGW